MATLIEAETERNDPGYMDRRPFIYLPKHDRLVMGQPGTHHADLLDHQGISWYNTDPIGYGAINLNNGIHSHWSGARWPKSVKNQLDQFVQEKHPELWGGYEPQDEENWDFFNDQKFAKLTAMQKAAAWDKADADLTQAERAYVYGKNGSITLDKSYKSWYHGDHEQNFEDHHAEEREDWQDRHHQDSHLLRVSSEWSDSGGRDNRPLSGVQDARSSQRLAANVSAETAWVQQNKPDWEFQGHNANGHPKYQWTSPQGDSHIVTGWLGARHSPGQGLPAENAIRNVRREMGRCEGGACNHVFTDTDTPFVPIPQMQQAQPSPMHGDKVTYRGQPHYVTDVAPGLVSIVNAETGVEDIVHPSELQKAAGYEDGDSAQHGDPMVAPSGAGVRRPTPLCSQDAYYPYVINPQGGYVPEDFEDKPFNEQKFASLKPFSPVVRKPDGSIISGEPWEGHFDLVTRGLATNEDLAHAGTVQADGTIHWYENGSEWKFAKLAYEDGDSAQHDDPMASPSGPGVHTPVDICARCKGPLGLSRTSLCDNCSGQHGPFGKGTDVDSGPQFGNDTAYLASSQDHEWMTGQCAAFAAAHHALHPHLQFGVHYEKMDPHESQKEAEENGEEWDGQPHERVQHVFTHDNKNAYDADGIHPLPYDDWDRSEYGLNRHQMEMTGMLEGGYIPDAHDHVQQFGPKVSATQYPGGSLPWQPGQAGRGLLGANGEFHAWVSDYDYIDEHPEQFEDIDLDEWHHGDMADWLGRKGHKWVGGLGMPETGPRTQGIYIDQDGHTTGNFNDKQKQALEGNGIEVRPDNWAFAKIATSTKHHTWKPGTYGKGFITNDGMPVTWSMRDEQTNGPLEPNDVSTGEYESPDVYQPQYYGPHHEEIATRMGLHNEPDDEGSEPQPHGWHTPVYIKPNGEVNSMGYWGGAEHGDMTPFADIGLTPLHHDPDWKFSAAEFGTAAPWENIKDMPYNHTDLEHSYHTWQPGQNGKGFIAPDGRAVTWNIHGADDPAFGGPHHGEVAEHLGLPSYPEPTDEAKQQDREDMIANGFDPDESEADPPSWHTPIYIKSDGTYNAMGRYWNSDRWKEDPETDKAFAQHGLKSEKEDWKFSASQYQIFEHPKKPVLWNPENGQPSNFDKRRPFLMNQDHSKIFVGQPGHHHMNVRDHFSQDPEHADVAWKSFGSVWGDGRIGTLGDATPRDAAEAVARHYGLEPYEKSPKQDPDDWTFAKTAAWENPASDTYMSWESGQETGPYKVEPYQPGKEGKGFIQNGKLTLWAIDKNSAPHHDDILGADEYPSVVVYINPDKTYEMIGMQDEDGKKKYRQFMINEGFTPSADRKFAKIASYSEEELPPSLSVFADGEYGFERWEPGHMGKGIVMDRPEGQQLLTWKVPKIHDRHDDSLHHGVITETLNSDAPHSYPRTDVTHEIWIDRDGGYTAFHNQKPEVPQQLDSRLHNKQHNPDEWKFAKEQMRAPEGTYDPSYGGKGVVLHNNEGTHFWPIDKFHSPHHDEWLEANGHNPDDGIEQYLYVGADGFMEDADGYKFDKFAKLAWKFNHPWEARVYDDATGVGSPDIITRGSRPIIYDVNNKIAHIGAQNRYHDDLLNHLGFGETGIPGSHDGRAIKENNSIMSYDNTPAEALHAAAQALNEHEGHTSWAPDIRPEGEDLKFASYGHQINYTPGYNHKGLVTPEGEVHIWPHDQIALKDDPTQGMHHQEYMETELGVDPDGEEIYDMHKPFTVDSAGLAHSIADGQDGTDYGSDLPWDFLQDYGIGPDTETGEHGWRFAKPTRTRLVQDAQHIEQEHGQPDQSHVLHTFPDGWTIRAPQTYGDLDREGQLMNNCWASHKWADAPSYEEYGEDAIGHYEPVWEHVAQPDDDDNPVWRGDAGWHTPIVPDRNRSFISLRDPDNIPHLSIGGSGNESLGRNNSEPKDEYLRRVEEWQDTKHGRGNWEKGQGDVGYWGRVSKTSDHDEDDAEHGWRVGQYKSGENNVWSKNSAMKSASMPPNPYLTPHPKYPTSPHSIPFPPPLGPTTAKSPSGAYASELAEVLSTHNQTLSPSASLSGTRPSTNKPEREKGFISLSSPEGIDAEGVNWSSPSLRTEQGEVIDSNHEMRPKQIRDTAMVSNISGNRSLDVSLSPVIPGIVASKPCPHCGEVHDDNCNWQWPNDWQGDTDKAVHPGIDHLASRIGIPPGQPANVIVTRDGKTIILPIDTDPHQYADTHGLQVMHIVRVNELGDTERIAGDSLALADIAMGVKAKAVRPLRNSLSLGLHDNPSTYREAKIGSLYHNWEPGRWGKGLVRPGGEIHTWPIDENSAPHHMDYVAENIMGQDHPDYIAATEGGGLQDISPWMNAAFVIDPDGEVRWLWGSNNYPEAIDLPGLKDKPAAPESRFASESATVFASAGDFHNWKPGADGKMIIMPNGEVHSWNTDEHEEPHHGDYLIENKLTPNPYPENWNYDDMSLMYLDESGNTYGTLQPDHKLPEGLTHKRWPKKFANRGPVSGENGFAFSAGAWKFAATNHLPYPEGKDLYLPTGISPHQDTKAEPWEKGLSGKGYTAPDGKGYLWRSEHGDPHHFDVVHELFPDTDIDSMEIEDAGRGFFRIAPDGEVHRSMWGHGDHPQFAAMHPDLWAQGDKGLEKFAGWKFSENLIDKWEPGKWGKGLANNERTVAYSYEPGDEGRIHHWDIRDADFPGEYLNQLHPFEIKPDGAVTNAHWEGKVPEHILGYHPSFHHDPEEGWHFANRGPVSAEKGFAFSAERYDPNRHGTAKGLIFPDGTTDFWQVDQYPHHHDHPRWNECVKSFTLQPGYNDPEDSRPKYYLFGGARQSDQSREEYDAIMNRDFPNIQNGNAKFAGAENFSAKREIPYAQGSALLPSGLSMSQSTEAEPWELGLQGKGLISNGQGYLWRSHSGDPHHPDVLYNVDPEYKATAEFRDDHGFFNIDPEGKVRQAFWGRGDPHQFADMHSDLRTEGQGEELKFAKTSVNINQAPDLPGKNRNQDPLQGRVPYVYDPETDTAHVGRSGWHHNGIIGDMGRSRGDWSGMSFGYVFPDEEPRPQHFWYSTIRNGLPKNHIEIEKALNDHLGIDADHYVPFDQSKFASAINVIQIPTRKPIYGMGARRPVIADKDNMFIGGDGAYHEDLMNGIYDAGHDVDHPASYGTYYSGGDLDLAGSYRWRGDDPRHIEALKNHIRSEGHEPWTYDNDQRFAKTAGKIEWLQERPDKFKDTPVGQDALNGLVTLTLVAPKIDPLTPWLWREAKKGRIRISSQGNIVNLDHPNGSFGREHVAHWADWFASRSPTRRGVDIMSLKFNDLTGKINEWNEELASKNQEADQSNGKVIHQLPNGWTIRELAPNDLSYEGDNMGHCVGGHGYEQAIANGMTKIISLRDEENKPHATMEIKSPLQTYAEGHERDKPWVIEQVQGKSNEIPKPEYQAMIKEWVQSLPENQRPVWKDSSEEISDINEIVEPEDDDNYGWGGYEPHGDYGVPLPQKSTDYSNVLYDIHDKGPTWRGYGSYDPAHGEAVYDHALKRGEIPQLAKAHEELRGKGQQDLQNAEEMNWDYLEYPGEYEDDEAKWEEIGKENGMTGRDAYNEAYENYSIAQSEIAENVPSWQAANHIADLLAPHWDSQTGGFTNEKPKPSAFSAWKFARELDEWHLGSNGKGYIDPHGEPLIWKVDNQGGPHHVQVFNERDEDPYAMIQIRPDGNIIAADPDEFAEVKDDYLNYHPDLKHEPHYLNFSSWKFAKAVA